MSNTVTWNLNNGVSYSYEPYALDASFNAVPGNYVFARQNQNGSYSAIYIGETDNLKERHENHEKRPCALKNGATHILARRNDGGQAVRRKEQDEMIAYCQPVCNVQGK